MSVHASKFTQNHHQQDTFYKILKQVIVGTPKLQFHISPCLVAISQLHRSGFESCRPCFFQELNYKALILASLILMNCVPQWLKCVHEVCNLLTAFPNSDFISLSANSDPVSLSSFCLSLINHTKKQHHHHPLSFIMVAILISVLRWKSLS